MENPPRTIDSVHNEYFVSSDLQGVLNNYTEKCEEYEEEFSNFGYTTPPQVATTGIEFLQRNTEDTKVLDFACGTGLVAAAMVAQGFKGEVHGLDGSGGMLRVARRKGIYRNLKEKIVLPGARLDYEDCSFDGVFNCGGFAEDQLQPGVIPELLRVVKRDGVVVITTRYNDPPMEYQKKFDSQVKDLEEKGLWRKASLEKAHYFNFDFYNKNQPLIATIYCYLKN